MSENNEKIYEIAMKHAVYNAFKHEGKAVLSIVVSKILAENPTLKDKIREIIPIIRRAVDEANRMSLEEQKRYLEEKYPELIKESMKKEEKEKILPPLPDTNKYKVIVTRFAPNPDFFIHLGNSRVAILSHEYARMYKGKMLLRFEDTDPRTKKPLIEAYSQIKEDLKWLGIKWDEEYIQSLRMKIYYENARRLIELGGAYIDTLKKEDVVKLLEEGKPHPQRESSIEENLELFDKMLEGHFGEGEAVLRIKTKWNIKDRSLIDWVAFRIIDTDKNPHPIVGSKYIVWPTYNFAAGIDDHLMGVTHIIRGKEHKQNTMKQMYMYKYLGWEYPTTIHVGRLRLEDFIMSKSAIRDILEKKTGGYTGPDDPRFGTIMGLRRRGITPEAIRSIMIDVGIKTSDAKISYANLAATNRKILDEKAPRLMYVGNPLELKVKEIPDGCLKAIIPYHPSVKEMGSREITVCNNNNLMISKNDYEKYLNKRIRLMDLANFTIENHELIYISKSLDEAKKGKLPIIQWVKQDSARPAILLFPEGEDIHVENGVIEEVSMLEKVKGQNIQLIRKGFVMVEEVFPYVKMVFSHI